MNTPHRYARRSLLPVLALAAASAAACHRSTPRAGPQPNNGPGGGAETPANNAAGVVRESGSPDRLSAFGTAAEVRRYFDAVRALEARQAARYRGAPGGVEAAAAAPAAAPTPQAPAASATGTTAANASITNNPEQGVDEGDIVKAHGDYLVILRRGRLFTVRVGDGAPRPVAMVDAFAPGATPASWYDEMLVEGNTVVVLGYGYNSGGTEVNLFDLDAGGHLTYRSTLFVRSSDYYSSRNYATRVVGHQLVMYLPVPLTSYENRDAPNLPAVRYSRGDSWTSVIDYGHLYRPVQSAGTSPLVHTVLFCDLRVAPTQCRAEGVIGPYSRTFYVSGRAVYVWVTGGRDARTADPDPSAGARESAPGAVLYRFPLDGSDPGAIAARGAPVDQFSFRETDEELQVLVHADGGGDGMWGPEVTRGALALLRVARARFGADVADVPREAYRALPGAGESYTLQNRFVGTYLLYGTGNGWVPAGSTAQHQVFAHAIDSGETTPLALPHAVDRIEPLGRDAVVVGSEGNDLHFTALALDARPTVADSYVRQGASQGETRSHGFFYNPDGERSGVLGLPLRSAGQPGYMQLAEGSAEVAFLRVRALHFTPLGGLRASAMQTAPQDGCRASCVDWYGNARPIFYRGQILALMGYELLAGRIANEQMEETARTDYFSALRAPAATAEATRPTTAP
jgi:hypothetical protein